MSAGGSGEGRDVAARLEASCEIDRRVYGPCVQDCLICAAAAEIRALREEREGE